MDNDIISIDVDKSWEWNYVARVEKELASCPDYESVLRNQLLPQSYREVISVLSRACNYSRVALLLDEHEEYVAFLLVVDEDCIPFLLDGLDEIDFPITAVYKVFYDTEVATSHLPDGTLQKYISETVLPDLNNNFLSWTHFNHSKI